MISTHNAKHAVLILALTLLISACSGGPVADHSSVATSIAVSSVLSDVSSESRGSHSSIASASTASVSVVSSSPVMAPGGDQCNTTAECRDTWPHATDCKNSGSLMSVCICGSAPCSPSSSVVSAQSQSSLASALSSTSSQMVNGDELAFNRASMTGRNPYREKPLRIGDPGVRFIQEKLSDAHYFAQMREWATAGVAGGIPYLSEIVRDNLAAELAIMPGATADDFNDAITQASRIASMQTPSTNGKQPNGQWAGVAIWIANGHYSLDKTVEMQSGVYLVGESREHVRLILNMKSGAGIEFGPGTSRAGIYRLTIEGGWGQPATDWNGSPVINDEGRNLNYDTTIEVDSVSFRSRYESDNTVKNDKRSYNHFLDQVSILNSSNHPVRNNGDHITLRDLYVNGAHLKGGGAQGYFFLMNNHNLVTGCTITHLRHISIQGDNAEYNVLIDNDFIQEISYHTDDDGNNLVEYNRLILPAEMPNKNPDYYPLMGPWSLTHHNINLDSQNYAYRNIMRMDNHAQGLNIPTYFPKRSSNDSSLSYQKERAYQHILVDQIIDAATPNVAVPNFVGDLVHSDASKVYKGPVIGVTKGVNHIINFPSYDESGNDYPLPQGGTFYPVVLDL